MKTDFNAPIVGGAYGGMATQEPVYEHEETRALVKLVDDAGEVIETRGENAFSEFRTPGSMWRHKETYIFVLDPEGKMLVHPDPELEGKSVIDLKDVAGRPIIRGLIDAATAMPEKAAGWYHYEWPVPGGIQPRWKSSYVRLVKAPSGKSFIVGTGVYNDSMERVFVVDAVMKAVHEIETRGEAAFDLLRDPASQFRVKDSYVFVQDERGIELVCAPFPNLEGSYVRDLQDTHGKYVNRELDAMVKEHGSGWVDYMWPRPGDTVSTLKSTFVSGARLGGKNLIVGCGVYLSGAQREKAPPVPKHTVQEMMALVREGASILAERGRDFFPELRRKGTKWFNDDTYFFVYSMDGHRLVQATEPETEGKQLIGLTDSLGRQIVKMALDAVASPSGEGWVHYMYPQPGTLFPTWKSSFVKRVTTPAGEPLMIGSGAYNMRMDKPFIEDLVARAALLISERGDKAFELFRDRKGPFVFMDTYVFVQTPEGTELVNPMQPALEGRNLIDLKDLQGKEVVREEIEAAMKHGSAWLEMYWYKPGENMPARKLTFVKRVDFGGKTYIVGSGIYTE